MIARSRKVVPKRSQFNRFSAQGVLKLRAYQKDITRTQLAEVCECTSRHINLMLGTRPDYLTPKHLDKLTKLLCNSHREIQYVYYLAAKAAGYKLGHFFPEKDNAEAHESTTVGNKSVTVGNGLSLPHAERQP